MDAKTILLLALKSSIFLTVASLGLQSKLADVTYLLRKPGLLARSLVAMFVIMPIFAFTVVSRFRAHPAVDIALLTLAISPIPPLLPRKVTKSGGLVPYGIALMVSASIFAIVFVPIVLEIIGLVLGRVMGMHPGAVAKLMATSILAPLALGMIFRSFAPEAAERIAKPLGKIALALLVLGVLVVSVAIAPVAWGLIGDGTILAEVAFVVIGLGVGHLLGGPDPDGRVTLALCTACRHPALALTIATANFPEEKQVVGAIFLYALLNAVVAIPYIKWQRKRSIGSAPTVEKLAA
jgi:BASS family bile acid:Na+ symporter